LTRRAVDTGSDLAPCQLKSLGGHIDGSPDVLPCALRVVLQSPDFATAQFQLIQVLGQLLRIVLDGIERAADRSAFDRSNRDFDLLAHGGRPTLVFNMFDLSTTGKSVCDQLIEKRDHAVRLQREFLIHSAGTREIRRILDVMTCEVSRFPKSQRSAFEEERRRIAKIASDRTIKDGEMAQAMDKAAREFLNSAYYRTLDRTCQADIPFPTCDETLEAMSRDKDRFAAEIELETAELESAQMSLDLVHRLTRVLSIPQA
jgi:hypothetical protein